MAKHEIFNTKTKMTQRSEQVTLDVYAGIGNEGEAGYHRSQADIDIKGKLGIVSVPNADGKRK
jgi:hypothetical protein